MPVTIKEEPRLVRPAGSHWLALATGPRTSEPYAKEELFPILELDAPRVGTVQATFNVDRYVASSYDERTNASTPVWSDWRIYLRDVRAPDPGREVSGVGDATRRAITAACLPIIRAWLDSDEYQQSRSRAALAAVRRELDAPRVYTLDGAADTLERVRGDLTPRDYERTARALRALRAALDDLTDDTD